MKMVLRCLNSQRLLLFLLGLLILGFGVWCVVDTLPTVSDRLVTERILLGLAHGAFLSVGAIICLGTMVKR